MKLKRLIVGKRYLAPENRRYAPIELADDAEVTVWGVVTHVIHEL
jgi:SOS-response transcriptional repressor LexA